MSDSAQIILALVGGLGGLYTLGQKLADWLRARADGEASTAKKALRIADRAREDTGKHVDRWASCEARCRELTSALARLEERLARLENVERENDELRSRVASLEEEVRRLRAVNPLRKELAASAERRSGTERRKPA